MDRKTVEKLVAVLDAEIAVLQRDREQILQMVSDNGASPKPPPEDTRFDRVSEPVRKVYAVLSASGKRMTAGDIFAALGVSGETISESRVRQILHQHQDKLFLWVRRGVWKAKLLDQ